MLFLLIVLVLAVVEGLSSVYVVDETENAVIRRFGKYQQTVDSGLHFKLSFGIDKNYNVDIKTLRAVLCFSLTKTTKTRCKIASGFCLPNGCHSASPSVSFSFLSSRFIIGKRRTSRIAAEFVSSIHIRSMPNPIPPVGGIPISSAFRKSSSV